MDPLARDLHLMDGLMPLVFAPVFVLLMSLIPEPARQRFNAVFAGAPSVTEWMRGANPAQIASRSEP